MPLTEALAAGIPLACSDILPFDGIAGKLVVRFAADSTKQMVDAMAKITSDIELRVRFGLEGPARARDFDWRETARRTLDLLRRVAEGNQRLRPPQAEQ